MKQFSKIMFLVLGFGLFAAVLSSLPIHPAAAAITPPAINVDVVNTPNVNAHITNTSIPVTGSVNAAVTGTVAVSSLPAVTISGTPSVEVTNFPPSTTSGSVTVSNTPTTAIPVVVAPAVSALYNSSCSGSWTGSPSASCAFSAVPSSMTLYIESATINSASPSGFDPLQSTFYSLSSGNAYIPMFLQSSAGGFDYYTGALVGHSFVSSTSSFGCAVQLLIPQTSGGVQCTVSGYLVPAS